MKTIHLGAHIIGKRTGVERKGKRPTRQISTCCFFFLIKHFLKFCFKGSHPVSHISNSFKLFTNCFQTFFFHSYSHSAPLVLTELDVLKLYLLSCQKQLKPLTLLLSNSTNVTLQILQDPFQKLLSLLGILHPEVTMSFTLQ